MSVLYTLGALSLGTLAKTIALFRFFKLGVETDTHIFAERKKVHSLSKHMKWLQMKNKHTNKTSPIHIWLFFHLFSFRLKRKVTWAQNSGQRTAELANQATSQLSFLLSLPSSACLKLGLTKPLGYYHYLLCRRPLWEYSSACLWCQPTTPFQSPLFMLPLQARFWRSLSRDGGNTCRNPRALLTNFYHFTWMDKDSCFQKEVPQVPEMQPACSLETTIGLVFLGEMHTQWSGNHLGNATAWRAGVTKPSCSLF